MWKSCNWFFIQQHLEPSSFNPLYCVSFVWKKSETRVYKYLWTNLSYLCIIYFSLLTTFSQKSSFLDSKIEFHFNYVFRCVLPMSFRCFYKTHQKVAVTQILNDSDCIQFLSFRYMSNPHTNTETMDKECINMSENSGHICSLVKCSFFQM